MGNVRRLQMMTWIWSQFNKVRRVHSESIVATSSSRHVYKTRAVYRRYLDELENVYHEYYKHNLIGTMSCLLTKSKVPLQQKTVHQALSFLCQRHTLLRARVIEAPDGVNNYYESVSGIEAHKINFHVIDKSVDERLAVWEKLLCSMDYEGDEGCLWKAFLLREKFDQHEQCYYNALMMIFSHSIADAGSMMSLNQQLLHYIEILAQGNNIKLDDVKEFPLFPSQKQLLAHKLRQFEKSARTSQDDLIIPSQTTKHVLATFPTSADQDLSPYPASKAMLRTIPHCVLGKLVNICRKHHSTLTGLLTAICHIAFSSLLDTSCLPADATNDTMTFTDTTKDYVITLPEGYPTNGPAGLAYNLQLPAKEEDMWNLAVSFTKQLRTDIKNQRHFQTLLSRNLTSRNVVDDNVKEGSLPLAERTHSNHVLSNPKPMYTRYDPTKMFSIEEAFGGLPVHGRNSTFRNYLLTLNGNMSYVTVYDGSFICTKVAQAYYDCMTRLIDNVLMCDNQISQ